MTNQQFIETITKFYARGVDLIRRKNADYATSDNPFKNFDSALVAGLSPERAILVRILDKFARISNLLGKHPDSVAVLDETIEDTLLDSANYLAILYAKLESNKQNKK